MKLEAFIKLMEDAQHSSPVVTRHHVYQHIAAAGRIMRLRGEGTQDLYDWLLGAKKECPAGEVKEAYSRALNLLFAMTAL